MGADGVSALTLRLRAGAGKRARAGHPWVFSNEVVEVPGELQAGDVVDVVDDRGRFVGRGDANPGSLICVRLLSRDPAEELGRAWLRRRLAEALERRRWWAGDRRSYRWVHAEGDELSGLIIDRYRREGGPDGVVIAANSAGMDRRSQLLASVLREDFDLAVGIWRNDGRGRRLEGLAEHSGVAWGDPGELPWIVWEGGRRRVEPLQGQKTGTFLDMQGNRQRMVPALGLGRVADLFCYGGAWGLGALEAGADEVVFVDRSQPALELVRANLTEHPSARAELVSQDVRAWLRRQPASSFEGVICDPPSFIRSRKDVASGSRAYKALFADALRLLRPGGRAVLASCSHHLFDDRFARLVQEAARKARVELRVLIRGEQPPDHPVPLAFPEGRYLKTWLVEVSR